MPLNHFPVQVFKYCPRCGSGQFRPDDHKLIRCKSCGLEMYFNVAAAVAALIFDSEGRLLFTIRKHEPAKGLLDLPGGFVDNDESAEEALVREVKEELNLDIIESRYITSLPNLYLYEGITYRTLDFIFECKVKNLGNIEPNDDVDGYRFIHPNTEMADQVGLLSIRKLMDLYLQRPD